MSPYVRPRKRQREVLALLLVTGSYEVAAARLGITVGTAHAHMTQMRARLGVERNEQAVYLGLRDGWISVALPVRGVL